MSLAKDLKTKYPGMDSTTYHDILAALDAIADGVVGIAKAIRTPGTGLYWPLEDLPVLSDDVDYAGAIKSILKDKGMEFMTDVFDRDFYRI